MIYKVFEKYKNQKEWRLVRSYTLLCYAEQHKNAIEKDLTRDSKIEVLK